jgi:hypothetical protein
MLQTSTLRPGLLVSLRTSIHGGVKYDTRDIEREHVTTEGQLRAAWETVKTVEDPAEHEAAVQARSKARSVVTALCAASAFGLLCPTANADELAARIAEARRIAEEFNAKAAYSRLTVNVIAGRIAPDDVEAVRAINSEVRELLETMERGVANLDVKAIRDAAQRAKSLGSMLTPETEARVRLAVDAARSAARKIVKAGEAAAQEVDRVAIRKIMEARTAFLDLGEARDVEAPTTQARAIDLEADLEAPRAPRPAAAQMEV